MAKYIFSNIAVEDLSSIWIYTYNVWAEKQADKYYNLLLDSCKDLAAAKIAGKHYPEIDRDIFRIRILQHIIFYRLLKNDNLEIVRIIHSRMDLKNRITK